MNYDSLFDGSMSPDLTADMGYQNEPGADTESMGSVAASSIFQGRMDRVGGMGMGGHTGPMIDNGSEFRANDDGAKPHILMFGLKRSGKSSILRVVFDKMDPRNTRQLESTKGLEKSSVTTSSFVKFEMWEFPGQLDWDPCFDSDDIFGNCGALIWVCDAQEDYQDSFNKFIDTVARAYNVNPSINFNFFIHKVDGLSDDHKIECQRDIMQQCHDALHEYGLESIQITTHLTSIYDHSIYDAFSKVIQKITPQLSTFETLLDSFATASNIDRAFLADIPTKIYLASNQGHMDMSNFELYSDMIVIVSDILSVYAPQPQNSSISPYMITGNSASPSGMDSYGDYDDDDDDDAPINGLAATAPMPVGGAAAADESGELGSGGKASRSVSPAMGSQMNGEGEGNDDARDDIESFITLSEGMVLYFHTVDKYLAVVCLMREESFKKKSLIDYNFECFRNGLKEVLAIQDKK